MEVAEGLIPYAEVTKHNTPNDCWVIIEGKVYDLTQVCFENQVMPGCKISGTALYHTRVHIADVTELSFRLRAIQGVQLLSTVQQVETRLRYSILFIPLEPLRMVWTRIDIWGT
jgi:hypothetical protein